MGQRRKLRIEDAARAVLRGQNYVGLAPPEPKSEGPRHKPTLPKLRCQSFDMAAYDDPSFRRWAPHELFG